MRSARCSAVATTFDVRQMLPMQTTVMCSLAVLLLENVTYFFSSTGWGANYTRVTPMNCPKFLLHPQVIHKITRRRHSVFPSLSTGSSTGLMDRRRIRGHSLIQSDLHERVAAQ